MNKKFIIGALALSATAILGLSGCSSDKYQITFDSDPTIAEDNVVVEFKKGTKFLESIPTPVEKQGFAGVWENFELKNESFTVKARYGDGSSNNPFMIENANQFKNLMVDCTTTSENLTPTKYYKLIKDINLSEINLDSSNISEKYFNGVLDGDGHALLNLDGSKLNQTSGALFANVNGATFKNLNIYLGENIGSLAGNICGNTKFDNVKIYNAENLNSTFVSPENSNESAFCFNAVKGQVYFYNCVNYANYVSESECNGVFLGGYATNNVELTFANCENYGNITTSGTYGILIGNPYQVPKTLQVSKTKNFGVVVSKNNSATFVVGKVGDDFGEWENTSYLTNYNNRGYGYKTTGTNQTFLALEETN